MRIINGDILKLPIDKKNYCYTIVSKYHPDIGRIVDDHLAFPLNYVYDEEGEYVMYDIYNYIYLYHLVDNIVKNVYLCQT